MPSDSYFELFLQDVDPFVHDCFDWKDFRIGYFISKNKAKTSQNEDCLFILGRDKTLVFGVSDGAGGHPKGKEASLITGQKIIEKYKSNASEEVNSVFLLEKINDDIIGMKAGAHCTLAMVTIDHDLLRSFSVGDSEIIYWNTQAAEIYSNIPHSEVGYQIEGGVLEQKDSLDDPDRHVVTNMLGDDSIRIEFSSKKIMKRGHTILVGSDGVFDNISHAELKKTVAQGTFEQSFDELVKKCIEQSEESWKKDDDISFVLVRKIKS